MSSFDSRDGAVRFGSDERLALGAATLFASIVIPVAVLAIGSAWAGVVEIIKLGNEHIGQRARFDGLRANFLVMLGVGIIAVWAAGAVTTIRNRTRVVRSEGQTVGPHASPGR
jgi:hypothetical protein